MPRLDQEKPLTVELRVSAFSGEDQMHASSRPRVSIIVPAYQTAHLIGETMESILAQAFTAWEAIVIDDGSTDDLRGALLPYSSDPRISLHRIRNSGVAAARNRGIELAQGRYVTFLDSDDMVEPNYLTEMIGVLEANPSLAFACCDGVMFGVPDREGRRFSEFEPQVPPITLDRLLTRKFVVPITSTARREAVRSVGGFATDLRSAEDFDLWLRILLAGRQASYIAKPLFRYRRRAGSLTNSPEPYRLALAEVYNRTANCLGPNHPLAAVCHRAERNILARLELWRARKALAEGRAKDAKKHLSQAMQVLDSPRWKLMLGLTRIAPWLAVTTAQWADRRRSSLEKLTGSENDTA